MNREFLYDRITNIDPAYIEEAENYKFKTLHKRATRSSVAACLCPLFAPCFFLCKALKFLASR